MVPSRHFSASLVLGYTHADYKEFLMGGIFAQTIVFGAFGVALALSHDRNNGAIDRFHSLPIPRATILVGRSISSLIHSSIGIAVMALTGLLIGWRIRRWNDCPGHAPSRSPNR